LGAFVIIARIVIVRVPGVVPRDARARQRAVPVLLSTWLVRVIIDYC
jgi:hypothetical protein